MKVEADLAIVGSGFGGSLAALVARRLGLSVLLLERGTHPRFAIGESSSPLANLLLEELATRYRLPRLRPLCKWGTWRSAYPDIGCGLKRGFTFYRHERGRPFRAAADRSDQLLVGASPRDEVADTHWYRPDFDHFLVREAQAAGAEYFDRVTLDEANVAEGRARLVGTRGGESFEASARLVVDASGPRGFLSRALAIPESSFEALPPTAGLFTHFEEVRRFAETGALSDDGEPPYPPDDAAVHHVFDGGWIWVLRFGNGVTSAGVAAEAPVAARLGLADGAAGWARLLGELPSVRETFEGARAILPFFHRARLPYRASRGAGPGWTMLPSAAGFVNPMLSTGFPLTLLGIARLGRALEEDWGSRRFTARLEADAAKSLFESDAAALLVAALYASFSDFPLFAELSKLYFAAASFSEAARRLGRPERAPTFLCADAEPYGRELVRHCRESIALRAAPDSSKRAALLDRIRETIAPLDVAGLTRSDRRGWYPFRGEDLVENAARVGATPKQARELLERCGLSDPHRPRGLAPSVTPVRTEATSDTRPRPTSRRPSTRG